MPHACCFRHARHHAAANRASQARRGRVRVASFTAQRRRQFGRPAARAAEGTRRHGRDPSCTSHASGSTYPGTGSAARRCPSGQRVRGAHGRAGKAGAPSSLWGQLGADGGAAAGAVRRGRSAGARQQRGAGRGATATGRCRRQSAFTQSARQAHCLAKRPAAGGRGARCARIGTQMPLRRRDGGDRRGRERAARHRADASARAAPCAQALRLPRQRPRAVDGAAAAAAALAVNRIQL